MCFLSTPKTIRNPRTNGVILLFSPPIVARLADPSDAWAIVTAGGERICSGNWGFGFLELKIDFCSFLIFVIVLFFFWRGFSKVFYVVFSRISRGFLAIVWELLMVCCMGFYGVFLCWFVSRVS